MMKLNATGYIKLFIFTSLLMASTLVYSDEFSNADSAVKFDAFYAISKAWKDTSVPEGGVVTKVNASLVKGAYLLIGCKDDCRFIPDKVYWEIELSISKSTKYHQYISNTVIDTESGEIQ